MLSNLPARKLIQVPKRDKVSGSSRQAIAISVKTVEAEQTDDHKQKAIRLYCRAMIRLYLLDNENP